MNLSMRLLKNPFSILVRIEPHATRSTRPQLVGTLNFQYPGADRASCNTDQRTRSAEQVFLSVSWCGSSLMQRLFSNGCVLRILPFSILVRIEPHATETHDRMS